MNKYIALISISILGWILSGFIMNYILTNICIKHRKSLFIKSLSDKEKIEAASHMAGLACFIGYFVFISVLIVIYEAILK